MYLRGGHQEKGVGFLKIKATRKAIIGCWNKPERAMMITLKYKAVDLNIMCLCTYVPTLWGRTRAALRNIWLRRKTLQERRDQTCHERHKHRVKQRQRDTSGGPLRTWAQHWQRGRVRMNGVKSITWQSWTLISSNTTGTLHLVKPRQPA